MDRAPLVTPRSPLASSSLATIGRTRIFQSSVLCLTPSCFDNAWLIACIRSARGQHVDPLRSSAVGQDARHAELLFLHHHARVYSLLFTLVSISSSDSPPSFLTSFSHVPQGSETMPLTTSSPSVFLLKAVPLSARPLTMASNSSLRSIPPISLLFCSRHRYPIFTVAFSI